MDNTDSFSISKMVKLAMAQLTPTFSPGLTEECRYYAHSHSKKIYAKILEEFEEKKQATISQEHSSLSDFERRLLQDMVDDLD